MSRAVIEKVPVGLAVDPEAAVDDETGVASFTVNVSEDDTAGALEIEPFTKSIRLWNGGPGDARLKIRKPGRAAALQFSRLGYMVLENKADYELAWRVLRHRWWVDDMTSTLTCPSCKWSTNSSKAFQWHVGNSHARPQGE